MLNQDFKEFIASLNANQVRYLLIGGYAANAARMVEALEDFGFCSLGLQADDFVEADQIIQLGYPLARIDLVNLRRNKRAVGRMQDLADLENLR